MDVGCGQGFLARELAQRCKEVIAIDLDEQALERAKNNIKEYPNVRFVFGDVMSGEFADSSFDLITAVATLHHLPLDSALIKFRNLLRPGGVLAVIGLYRAKTIMDYSYAAVAFPTSWVLGSLYGRTDVGAPIQDPRESLKEIRQTFHRLLPGTYFRRQLLFRYSAIWRKPQ